MKQKSTTADDVALSAYIDGELPQDEADKLTERLATEPSLARRLEALRGTDDATRELFAKLDSMPMPPAVLDLLRQPKTSSAKSNVVALPVRLAKRFFELPAAIAASVALLAGILLGDLLRDEAGSADSLSSLVATGMTRDSELYGLLESGISNETRVLANGASGRVRLTFEDRAGDYCRQFRLTSEVRTAEALACRRGGGWQLEVLEFGPAEAESGPYQQASQGSAALNAAVDALIGDHVPLDAGAETRVIQGGWKKIPE